MPSRPQVAAAPGCQVAAARRPAAQGGPDRHPAVPGAVGTGLAGRGLTDARLRQDGSCPAPRLLDARLARARLGGSRLSGPGLPENGPGLPTSWPAPAPAVRVCRADGRPGPAGIWPVRAGRPPPADERSLSATSWVYRRRMALASTPMEDSLATQVLGRDPKLFGDLMTPAGCSNQISLPRHRSSGRADRPARPARSTFRFFSASTAALAATVSVTFRAPLDAAPPHRHVQALWLPAQIGATTGRLPGRVVGDRPGRRTHDPMGGYASRSSPGTPHGSAAAFGSHRPAAWPHWHLLPSRRLDARTPGLRLITCNAW